MQGSLLPQSLQIHRFQFMVFLILSLIMDLFLKGAAKQQFSCTCLQNKCCWFIWTIRAGKHFNHSADLSLSVLLEKSITVALTDCRSMIKGSQQQRLMQYKITKQKRTQRNEKRNYKASVHFVLALEFITTICILLPIKTVVIHTYISTTSYMYFSFKNKQTNK